MNLVICFKLNKCHQQLCNTGAHLKVIQAVIQELVEQQI